MALPNAKDLVKLANACRKAGILTFKGDGIEFTLTEATPPAKRSKKAVKAAEEASAEAPDTDEPGYEQLLYWSINGTDPDKQEQ